MTYFSGEPAMAENPPRRRLLLSAFAAAASLSVAAGLGLGLGFAPAALAQGTGLLYDPQPPADSAYVRIIALGNAPVDVILNGTRRIKGMSAGEPSDYLVLPAGSHHFELRGAGSTARQATVAVQAGRAMTIAFVSPQADAAPLLFEDRPNTNKLKALVAVYHLHQKSGALDMLAGDGGTRVFSAVTYGASNSLSVNPITVDLFAAAAGEKGRITSTSLSMAPGGTYSLFLVPNDKNALELRGRVNRVERYTGSAKSS
jgi:alginate O-acetyltransferase complex protein AlgF